MIIDIPLEVEQLIITKAKAQKMTVEELIIQWAIQAENEINPMIALALAFPKSTSFDGIDAVELQRKWRDEWCREESFR